VNENRGKVAVGDLSKVEAAVVEVRRVAQTDDVAAIKKATEDLQHASTRLPSSFTNRDRRRHRDSRRRPGRLDVKDGEVVDAEYAETK